VIAITVADLLFRFRQFLIAIVGAALVFAMTLLLAGLSAGFRDEINQTVQAFGARAWIVQAGSAGRVTSLAPIPASSLNRVEQFPGAVRPTAVVIVPLPATLGQHDSASIHSSDIVLVGQDDSGQTSQKLLSGRWPGPGQAVVDSGFNAALGQYLTISGHVFKVVGRVSDRTLLGGSPLVYVSLADAQTVAFGGRPLINAVLVNGIPAHLPAGLVAYSNTRVELSSLDQMSGAVSSVDSARSFMWIIATIIVAALVYVSALQRIRDFAVLRALGASASSLFLSLAGQAVAISIAAALVALVIAHFMTGIFALRVDIPTSSFATLPLSAVFVGLVAALAALRRSVSVDPSTAFANR
jgi:putative ABC transport system permease protein